MSADWKAELKKLVGDADRKREKLVSGFEKNKALAEAFLISTVGPALSELNAELETYDRLIITDLSTPLTAEVKILRRGEEEYRLSIKCLVTPGRFEIYLSYEFGTRDLGTVDSKLGYLLPNREQIIKEILSLYKPASLRSASEAWKQRQSPNR